MSDSPAAANALVVVDAIVRRPKKITRLVYSKRFETWWKNYPPRRRTAKRDAYKAWLKAVEMDGGDEEAFYLKAKTALEWQLNSIDWNRNDGEFVPMPTTYLNQGRYEDDEPKERG